MKVQNALGVPFKSALMSKTPSAKSLSIKGMDEYLHSNPFKILSDMVTPENKKPEHGLREILIDILFSGTPAAHKAELLVVFTNRENVEEFANELSDIFNELNLVNLLYEYKDEKDLLSNIFTLREVNFKDIETIDRIFKETLKKPYLLGATKLLVEEGFNINAKDFNRMLPIHFAAESGNVDAIKYCESKGNDINAKDHSKRLPIHFAAESGNVDAIKYCESKGNDINIIEADGTLPIHFAAKSGNVDAIKYCESKDNNINIIEANGILPIHFAAYSGNVDAIKYCESKGNDINAKDHSKRLPIHFAAYSGNVDAIEYCVSGGDDVNDEDYSSSFPIHTAVKYGTVESVLCLLKHGATIPEDCKFERKILKAQALLAEEQAKALHDQGADCNDIASSLENTGQQDSHDPQGLHNTQSRDFDTTIMGSD